MRRTLPLALRPCIAYRNPGSQNFGKAPIIQIKDGTFYRRQPSETPSPENPPLFPNLDFTLPSETTFDQYWAIIGPSAAGKSTFLQILQGQHLCFPPNARLYPYLSSDEIASKDTRLRYPARAIQYVGFTEKKDALSAGMGSYLSARYESRREASDYSLLDYLKGNTALNASEDLIDAVDDNLFNAVVDSWNLRNLLNFPVHHLSNGQTRRSRIAKALLAKPEVLLLDEPFLGLDPLTAMQISPVLKALARKCSPRLILSLRSQDPIPDWITHLLHLGEKLKVVQRGPVADVIESMRNSIKGSRQKDRKARAEIGNRLTERGVSRPPLHHSDILYNWNEKKSFAQRTPVEAEPVIEMSGLKVQYEDRIVLGDWKQDIEGESKAGLWWNIRRGSRWGLFGANGSGKTTLLSLITSDHPQTYSAPIKLFGRSRLPSLGKRGISIFDIQARMGHSSPEVHHLFPRGLSVRRALESAYAETPLARARLSYEDDLKINFCLHAFRNDICQSTRSDGPDSTSTDESKPDFDQVEWADDMLFGELPTGAQKVVLFLRATIRNPELVILDEAFSGMDDRVRDKCMLFLENPMRIPEFQRLRKFLKSQDYQMEEENDSQTSTTDDSSPVKFDGLKDSQTLLVISHIPEEVPFCVNQYLCLPEQGSKMPPKIGKFEAPVKNNVRPWHEMWNVKQLRPNAPRKRGRYRSRVSKSATAEQRELRSATPKALKPPKTVLKLQPNSNYQKSNASKRKSSQITSKILATCSVCQRTKILAQWYSGSICGSCYNRTRNPSRYVSPAKFAVQGNMQIQKSDSADKSIELSNARSEILARVEKLIETKSKIWKSLDELLQMYSEVRVAEKKLEGFQVARPSGTPLEMQNSTSEMPNELDVRLDSSGDLHQLRMIKSDRMTKTE